MRYLLFLTAAVLSLTAPAAHAAVESVHSAALRESNGNCKGDQRTWQASRLSDMGKVLNLIGPGEFTLELFAHGIDIDPNAIHISGSNTIRIVSRKGTNGPANLRAGCGGIGSVQLTLKVSSVTSHQDARLHVGDEFLAVTAKTRNVTELYWRPQEVTVASNCLKRFYTDSLRGAIDMPTAVRMLQKPDTPSSLELRISPSALKQACRDHLNGTLALNFDWKRETPPGHALYDSAATEPVRITVKRTQQANNIVNFALPPYERTQEWTETSLRLDLSDLSDFIGTTTYEISATPAYPSQKPLILTVQSEPANGVRDMTLSAPAPVSADRRLRASYTLQVPTAPGTQLQWSTLAFNEATLQSLHTCYAVPEGTITPRDGVTTGMLELLLTDAPGCAGALGSVTVKFIRDNRPSSYTGSSQDEPLAGKTANITLPRKVSLDRPYLAPVTAAPTLAQPPRSIGTTKP
ncbi:hypothetical protein [Asticcacaulis sp. AND118]|uniref:hypothetical protein n=1 Tax=Asticcacaulis sp. AND118 TaxID=2840468 RepID=UPI001CFFA28A|nr:hypothetical protein [Asticcacaulis sp. AND118]UDF05726.1 hypothetical protein LH365_17965 [Asticcacaulis sp. AND118]